MTSTGLQQAPRPISTIILSYTVLFHKGYFGWHRRTDNAGHLIFANIKSWAFGNNFRSQTVRFFFISIGFPVTFGKLQIYFKIFITQTRHFCNSKSLLSGVLWLPRLNGYRYNRCFFIRYCSQLDACSRCSVRWKYDATLTLFQETCSLHIIGRQWFWMEIGCFQGAGKRSARGWKVSGKRNVFCFSVCCLPEALIVY